jgi:hypothetical protein
MDRISELTREISQEFIELSKEERAENGDAFLASVDNLHGSFLELCTLYKSKPK